MTASLLDSLCKALCMLCQTCPISFLDQFRIGQTRTDRYRSSTSSDEGGNIIQSHAASG